MWARIRSLLGTVSCCSIIVTAICVLQSARATTIWIDTDPSIGSPIREVDDGFALVLAFHCPELTITGISTTYGNASVRRTTAVAQDLVHRFGAVARLDAAAVHEGATSSRDLGMSTVATDALAFALRRERLTYVALGPLTNLGTLVRLHPDLVNRIDRVIFVGGQSGPGPISLSPNRALQIHDANVFKDPAAVRIVMESRLPILLTPIATASQLSLNEAEMKKLNASGEPGRYLYRNSRAWLWFWTRIARREGGPIFDALAVVAAIRPDLLLTETRTATDSQGRLVVSRRHGRMVRWCSNFAPRTKAFVIERLTRVSDPEGKALRGSLPQRSHPSPAIRSAPLRSR